jgi:hypothetical protein
MTHIEEHRRFRRIPFEAQAVIRHGQDRWEAQLLDISLKGALLTWPTGWRGGIGDPLELELIFDKGALVLRMATAVAHCDANHLGLHCLHIDLDSMVHLRRLVELNLGDTSQLNRELSALGTPVK